MQTLMRLLLRAHGSLPRCASSPRPWAHLSSALYALVAGPALAEPPQDGALQFQATWVRQTKPALNSPYAGPNSLMKAAEDSNSLTVTLTGGLRLARGTEIYADLEGAQGHPLSGLTGLGGFTNGEMARSSGPRLRAYVARCFVRQTWDDADTLADDGESIESAVHQLAGRQSAHRWVLSAGVMAVPDLFDTNAYSHDPRTQFLNWTLISQGAFDFAADARGYSHGLALERFDGNWAWRVGRFEQPREPNQQALDGRLSRHYGDQLELEHAHVWDELPGRLRLLLFRNRARMARYADALAAGTPGAPLVSLDTVRDGDRIKAGAGLSLEQALPGGWGLFARASAADGKTEAYAFTEVDRSLSTGVLGPSPVSARPGDVVGVALARNELSEPHRHYLARGGQGFFLGDGRLNYRPELVFEAFYRLPLGKSVQLSMDWQRITNPGYNADRGPANFWSLRFHAEL